MSVPLAVPEPPVELDHVTSATLTLSRAVPLTTMEPAEVETLFMDGEMMERDGGVESVPWTTVGCTRDIVKLRVT